MRGFNQIMIKIFCGGEDGDIDILMADSCR